MRICSGRSVWRDGVQFSRQNEKKKSHRNLLLELFDAISLPMLLITFAGKTEPYTLLESVIKPSISKRKGPAHRAGYMAFTPRGFVATRKG
jgi:hypothetical protein